MKKIILLLALALVGCCSSQSADQTPVTNVSNNCWVTFNRNSVKVRLKAYLPHKWVLVSKQNQQATISVSDEPEKDLGWVPGDPVYYVFWVQGHAGHVYWKLVDESGKEVQQFMVIAGGR